MAEASYPRHLLERAIGSHRHSSSGSSRSSGAAGGEAGRSTSSSPAPSISPSPVERPAEGRLEVDHVAQQVIFRQKFVAPDGDGLEGQRAFASPAIIVLRPASIRWRWQSRPRATEAPLSPSRAGTSAPGSSVRSSVSEVVPATAFSREDEVSTSSPVGSPSSASSSSMMLIAHFREHRHHVLDLLRRHLFRRQDRVLSWS